MFNHVATHNFFSEWTPIVNKKNSSLTEVIVKCRFHGIYCIFHREHLSADAHKCHLSFTYKIHTEITE